MRYVIYGAGGIGGTMGGRLALADREVVLIARGAHADAMQSNGLRLITPAGSHTLKLPVYRHPEELQWRADDVVVLAMKSQHTAAALEQLAFAAGDAVPVICAQNGVANERMALRIFANVYGMLVNLPAEHLEPGLVVTHAEGAGGVLDCGRYPQGVDAVIAQVAADLTVAGFSANAVPNVMRQKYAKLLLNLGNVVQAALGDRAAAPELIRALRDEALAVYAAAGIDCASGEEVKVRSQAYQYRDVPGHPRIGGSTLQSLKRGAPDLETDYLNGEITQLGRLYGVATPVNAGMQRVARQLLKQTSAPGSMTLAEFTQIVNTAASEH